MLIYVISYYPSFMIPRTYSNSLETLLLIFGINFYTLINTKKKPLFEVNIMALTAIATLGLFIRNTSVIAWTIPVLYLMVYRGCFKQFVVSAITVALPI